jgi:hypothetical protein
MKNSKTALAPEFFCGMLRFRTREAAIFSGVSAFVEERPTVPNRIGNEGFIIFHRLWK